VFRQVLGPAQPLIQWVTAGTKWPGREADQSPPSRAKVKKNAWIYAFIPPIRLHGVVRS